MVKSVAYKLLRNSGMRPAIARYFIDRLKQSGFVIVEKGQVAKTGLLEKKIERKIEIIFKLMKLQQETKMPKLTKTDRDDLQCLLETHAELCAAVEKIGKRGIITGITTTNTHDDSDFVSVTIDSTLAKQAVATQREKVEKSLAKYGVIFK